MPLFQVIDSFAIESRALFVLAGSITEGTIKPGMLVQVPFNGAISMTGAIDSIEYVRREGGGEDIGLCIRCANADELSLWLGLDIKGETLDVADQTTDQAT